MRYRWPLTLILLAASCGSGVATATGPGSSLVTEEPAPTTTAVPPIESTTAAETSATIAIEADPNPLDGLDGPILELLANPVKESFDGYDAELASLLMDPRDLSTELRLLTLVVDDPNGDAMIHDRWYPPRVVSDVCNANLDTAPVPSVGAAFVPGHPSSVLASTGQPSDIRALGEAPFVVSVMIQLLDTSEQRDSLAEATANLFLKMDFSECDLFSNLDEDLPDEASSMLDISVVSISGPDTGYPLSAFEIHSFQATRNYQYLVGERVLLTVSLAEALLPGSEGLSLDEIDPEILNEVISTQIDRLVEAGLG